MKTNILNRYMLGVFTTLYLCINPSQAKEFGACYLPLDKSPVAPAFFGSDFQPGIIIEWQTTGDAGTTFTTSLKRGGGYSKVLSTTFNNKKPFPDVTSFTGIYQRAITSSLVSEDAVEYFIGRTLKTNSKTEYTDEWEFKYKNIFKPASEKSSNTYVSAIPMSCRIDYADERTVYSPNIPPVEKEIVDSRFARMKDFDTVAIHIDNFSNTGSEHSPRITNKCYLVDKDGKQSQQMVIGWGFDINGNLITTRGETNLKSSLKNNKRISGQDLTSLTVDRAYCTPHRFRPGYRDLTNTFKLERDGSGWKYTQIYDKYWDKEPVSGNVVCKAADEEKQSEELCILPQSETATPAERINTLEAFERAALLFY